MTASKTKDRAIQQQAATLASAREMRDLMYLVIERAKPVGDVEQAHLSHDDVQRFRAVLARIAAA